jgi:hypothetical protein
MEGKKETRVGRVPMKVAKEGNVSKAEPYITEGVAKTINFDDCVNFGFTVAGRDFQFKKKDHDSWVETVKNSKRNGTKISVTDEGDAPPPFTPTDIHDL